MAKNAKSRFLHLGSDWKESCIGGIYNLTTGLHTWTLQVDPDSPEGRKKISLDSFDIIKAPLLLVLDSPSIAPLRKMTKPFPLKPTQAAIGKPSQWPSQESKILSFAYVMKCIWLVSGDQDYPISPRQSSSNPNPWRKPIAKLEMLTEAYTICWNTTSSPIVAAFD